MKARKRTDLVIETRVRPECFVEALKELGDVVWVATRKGAGHDVPMHHHRAHLPLVQPQRFQHPLPPAEHGRGAEGHHGEEGGGLDGAPRQEHEVDEEREATSERMPRESKLCRVPPTLQVVLDLWHELLVYSLRRFIDPSMYQHLCVLFQMPQIKLDNFKNINDVESNDGHYCNFCSS